MRTIKFRGYSALKKEWLYGSLHVFEGVRMPSSPRTYIRAGQHNKDWHRVEPHTVGQFTGLQDCNETEIYEGDIITVKGNYPRVVLWDKVSWALMPCEYYYDKQFWVMNLQHPGNDWWEEFADEMEVVGNMYDNPGLLKPNSNAITL